MRSTIPLEQSKYLARRANKTGLNFLAVLKEVTCLKAKVSRSEEGFVVSLSDGRSCYFVERQVQWETHALPSGGELFLCEGICDLGFIKTQIEYLAGEEKVKFFF